MPVKKMAGNGLIDLIHAYEKRAGMKPSPRTLLTALTEDQARKHLASLRFQAHEEYFTNPEARHTVKPRGIYQEPEAERLDWLEKLHAELELHFVRSSWENVSKAEVMHEIGRLEKMIRPAVADIDWLARLEQYAEPEMPSLKTRITGKQSWLLSQCLVKLGYEVRGVQQQQINRMTRKQAGALISHLVTAIDREKDAAGWDAPTWTPRLPLPTRREILERRTKAGAWDSPTLKEWGVGWPPPKGWRERLEWLADREYGPSS